MSASCTPRRVYTKLHTDDDFLSRIRGSMNGPWAINGPHAATHTHSTGPSFSLLLSLLLRHFLLPLPRACSRSHAIALALRYDAR